ncbi:MAG: asparagine--tRNA ligase [Eubacteriales bacterium]
MKRTEIKDIWKNADAFSDQEITVCGWCRTIRASNAFGFIELNDGSCFKNLQVVFEAEKLDNYKTVAKQNVGAAVSVTGTLVLTPESKQPFELKAAKIDIEGTSTPDYPMQKKGQSLEFLRTKPHLRPRTNLFSAVFRVRSMAAQILHRFFYENGFVYVHTPLITTSDCEGAGDMFKVTTFDFDNIPRNPDGTVNYSEDFFCKPASLTVSGQLNVESYAMAFSKVYTFGPTFRAERSNTPRHAAEFWMLEPEIAFADLADDMELAEKMLKYVISALLDECRDELEFFNQRIDKGLIERLQGIVNSDFAVCTYEHAIELLKESGEHFEYPIGWGEDLQTEHERYLTEKVYKSPVFVTNWPREIKAFYMRLNDDNKTVAAVDLLVPGVGELIGGSQREERMDYLDAAFEKFGLDKDAYGWYAELRKFGGTKHAGFGLGFERLIMYVTGMQNIRDVESFPRTTGNAEF